MTKKNTGFTLIELLVAVVLMLLLVGTVVLLFKKSSDIFTVSEAKMDIFQNARVALDMMSREIASMQVDTNNPLVLDTTEDGSDKLFMSFTTVTSFQTTTGRFRVVYRIQKAGTNNNRWNLVRDVVTPNPADPTDNSDVEATGVLAQFIRGDGNNGPEPELQLNTFTFTGGQWTATPVAAGQPAIVDPAQLPPAIRITMDMTDRLSREVRTLSRTFWIATNESN